MGKILVCQHVAHEILGTLNPLFKKAGFRIRYVNFGRFPEMQPNLEGYDGLVLLGGPMNVDQTKKHPHLNYEMHLIERALKKQIPILGICLGAQLIAKTLGAKVGPNSEKEIGWYDLNLSEGGKKDPLLKNFHKKEKIFQWHGDTFEIPKTAVHLATSPTCPNQAFRYGDQTYAFQFHLEVDEPMIERWLRVPHHLEELKALKGKIDPKEIHEVTPHHIERLKQLSNTTFGQFIQMLGGQKKYHCPPSR